MTLKGASEKTDKEPQSFIRLVDSKGFIMFRGASKDWTDLHKTSESHVMLHKVL